MFKSINPKNFYHLINHGPCVLITSGKYRNVNIAPIAWIMPLNDEPPLICLAIAKNHYTSNLIMEMKEFVVNIPNKSMIKYVIQCGKTSGADTDKLKLTGLKIANGIKVKTPHLIDGIGFIECKLKNYKEYNGVILFIGDVLNCKVLEEYYDGYLLPEKAQTIHHLGGNYFATLNKRFKV